MGSIRTKIINAVNLLDVVEAAGEDAHAGSPIWDEMLNHHNGNQTFTNDSLFIYVLPTVNGDPLSDLQRKIAMLCRPFISDDCTIVFDVSW